MITGEMTNRIARAAREVYYNAEQQGIQEWMSILAHHGKAPTWADVERDEPRANGEASGTKTSRTRRIQTKLAAGNAEKSAPQAEQRDRVQAKPPVAQAEYDDDWQGLMTAPERRGWCATAPIKAGQTRIVSQNVGPVGARNSIGLIRDILRRNNPAVVMLQDCRIGKSKAGDVLQEFRRRWPQFRTFIKCSERRTKRKNVRGQKMGRYQFSVMTMVHKSCGESAECVGYKKGTQETPFEEGRLLSVQLTDAAGKQTVLTNIYNHTAAEGERQGNLLQEVERRIGISNNAGIPHILGGDWNASLFPEAREGAGTTNAQVRKADERLLEFVTQPSLASGWWAGVVVEGLLTRQDHSTGVKARLDEFFVQEGSEPARKGQKRRERGRTYEMRTAHTGQHRYDHGTLAMDIPSSLVQQPSTRTKSRKFTVPDKAKWSEDAASWSVRVKNEAAAGKVETDDTSELQRWMKIARKQLKRKEVVRGAQEHNGRRAYNTKEQSGLSRQIRFLESEVVRSQNRGTDDTSVTGTMRQVHTWPPSEGVTRINCPAEWNAETREEWIKDLRTGMKERRAKLKVIQKTQQKENLAVLRDQARQRMDRPREKEIARLMGKRQATSAAEGRKSRVETKQHPNCVEGCMTEEKWKAWFQTLESFDTSIVRNIQRQNSSNVTLEKATTISRGGTLVEITPQGGRNMKVRVSPLHQFTRFLSECPQLQQGEHVRVTATKRTDHHPDDTVAEDECFFSTNAMSHQSSCMACGAAVAEGNAITPMAWGSEGGRSRTIRYYCHGCRNMAEEVIQQPLQPCPIPENLFQDRKLDASKPILAKEISWEEFTQWIRGLAKGKSPGRTN